MKKLPSFVVMILVLANICANPLTAEPAFKIRALWVDTSGFTTEAATDEMLAKCQRAGINVILPLVFCYQTAHFKSPHFKGTKIGDDEFDPLAYLLRRAHAAKIQVQAWCCVYYEGGKESSNLGWRDLSLDGKPFEKNWISAANPEVNPYLLDVLKDLLAYNLDGIHLDYIRYPCTAFDYSPPARKAFVAANGFDPQDFIDHADKIVAPEKEVFPVRVLHANSHLEKIWKTTAIERTLDAAQIGFAFISESPENIEGLRTPGLLILSGYDDVSEPMLQAIQYFVLHGGDVLWCAPPFGALKQHPKLRELLGVSSGEWVGTCRASLRPASESGLSQLLGTNAFFGSVNCANKLDDAVAVEEFDTGQPAITMKTFGKGHVIALGFDAMDCWAGRAIPVVKKVVGWLRSESKADGPDMLAAKRAQWVQWRDDRVTQLVRGISKAGKSQRADFVITSSGGPGSWEFYGCYRNARRWLTEGINDFVFPMNYTPNPAEFADLLRAQAEAAPAGKFNCIYPGIQTYDNRIVDGRHMAGPLDADIVRQELDIVREQGYSGFCLFAYSTLSDDIIKVVRRYSEEGN